MAVATRAAASEKQLAAMEGVSARAASKKTFAAFLNLAKKGDSGRGTRREGGARTWGDQKESEQENE
jgi:hypothetical protein